ncbi:C-type lectin domain family 4 member F-like [Hoplias malabaricus]|uniref:C-type lectin domain family 4 member F-like n=1 Tax=Hoplias malabaricus TaxID=27720 RepID=UPI0034620E13
MGRHRKTWLPRERRVCQHCPLNRPETELHFLTECTKYNQIRAEFFTKISLRIPAFTHLPDSEKLPLGGNKECCPLAAQYVHASNALRDNCIHGNRSLVVQVSLGLVVFILFVMVFVVFGFQERKFAELERSVLSHNSSLNSVNSELKNNLKGSEPQMKKLSELQTLINSLGSSLGSVNSQIQSKLESTDGQFSEMKSFLDTLNSSLSEITVKLQDTVPRHDSNFREIKDSLTDLKSSLVSFDSKQQKQAQDSEERVMAALSEIKMKVADSDKAAESQNLTLSEVLKLSTSLQTLSSRLQSADEQVKTALGEVKGKLEGSSKTAESQEKILSEVLKLSSSLQSLSSKLQSTEERVISALTALKAKDGSSSGTADVSSCKPGWTSFGSKCFLFSKDELNWHQARDYCKSQNALLLKLETADEWAFVVGRQYLREYMWVGLTDENTGQWRWADETPYVMNSEQWSPGQPDDWMDHGLGEEGEDCAHLLTNGLLNDKPCSVLMKYICKT